MVMKITFLFILCLAGLFPALTTNQDHDNTAKKEQSWELKTDMWKLRHPSED